MSTIPSSFNPYLAYSASAGSGKTFALSVRYISLLFLGESPRNILAATFTNKAAMQMRERVVESLRLLAEDKNRPFLEAISKETQMSPYELLAKQPMVLERFLESSNFIVTLDSFFSSILRSSSFELGLEPEFVTKEQESSTIESIFLQEIKVMGLLESLAKFAIDIEDKRFNKIFALMRSLYTIDPILPKSRYTTTDISQIEVEIDRVRLEILELVVEAKASKSAINNFKEESIYLLSKKPLFAKESLLEHSHYRKYVEQNPYIDQLYIHLKALFAHWLEAREGIILEQLFELYSYYKNATISNAKHSSILDFDDLGFFTYRLLYETVSREFIYFKIDSKFKHILLDEFQDTSTLQYLLLNPLIEEIFAGRGQSEFRSFFYVGDTKQSLYRFRGGVEELFDKVADEFGMTIEPMDTNYRSSIAVVEQVNEWFIGKMEGYIPQNSRPDANIGFVEVVEPIDSDDEVDNPLLVMAVDKAKELIDRGVEVDDIAFLVFTNRDGTLLQDLCHNEGITTILKTSSSLQQVAKIASIVAVMKYLFYGKSQKYSALLASFLGRIEVDGEVKFEWFHPYLRPFDVIDRLVREFGYFESDPNILKLLEFATGYSNIPLFIEEFESASLSVASSTLHGAKIMTIHGSKGLEFGHVILVDKLTKPIPDRSTLLFEYDESLYIDRIFYRFAKRDQFDPRYRSLLDKRAILSAKDTLNVLYVALTRAVEEMVIIKKSDNSIFDNIGMEITQRGEPIIKEKLFDKTPTITKKSITIGNYGKDEIESNKDEDEERDYNAINFGLALHYTLEMMSSFDKPSIEIAIESSKNRYGLLINSSQWSDIVSRVTMLVEDSSFQNLLRDANIIKEQSISYGGELKQIDLLLEYIDSYYILEYKSSRKYHTKHIEQVESYSKAIESITAKETKGVIVYLLEGGVEFSYIG
jgi:exodeoxyribonuclease V beta subunit